MKRFVISEQPLDQCAIEASLSAPGAGAVVSFAGRVRDHARGHNVVRLEYDAYPEMAERVFAEISAEAKERFEIDDVTIHHRSGTLQIGEISVVVAVSAAHRGPAFDACRYVIDNLKQRVPIWKKEYGPDGATWIDERP